MRKNPAFTLAELLIALAILGVIATFTIPKVLSSQQDGRYKSIAKEAAGTISAAYQAYRLANTPISGTTPGDLYQYMNYVKYETATQIDDDQGNTTTSCTAGMPCLRLHNGAVLYSWGTASFGGTASTNMLWFQVDPDGTVTSPGGDTSPNAPGKSVVYFLYYDGFITDYGNARFPSINSANTFGPSPSRTPPWFSWN